MWVYIHPSLPFFSSFPFIPRSPPPPPNATGASRVGGGGGLLLHEEVVPVSSLLSMSSCGWSSGWLTVLSCSRRDLLAASVTPQTAATYLWLMRQGKAEEGKAGCWPWGKKNAAMAKKKRGQVLLFTEPCDAQAVVSTKPTTTDDAGQPSTSTATKQPAAPTPAPAVMIEGGGGTGVTVPPPAPPTALTQSTAVDKKGAIKAFASLVTVASGAVKKAIGIGREARAAPAFLCFF